MKRTNWYSGIEEYTNQKKKKKREKLNSRSEMSEEIIS